MFETPQSSPVCFAVSMLHTRREPSKEQVMIRCLPRRCMSIVIQSECPSSFRCGFTVCVFCTLAAGKDMDATKQ
jgi:hypothetical protein